MLLQYYCGNFDLINIIGKIEIIEGGQTATEDFSKK